MPSTTAQVAGNTLRRALAEITGGYRSFVTTSGGTAGGIDFIVSGLSGIGADYVLNMPWALAVDLANIREFRRAVSFSGTTVTMATTFSATVAISTTIDMYPFRPPLYKQAWNRAFQKLYPTVYRSVIDCIVADITRKGHDSAVADDFYSTPPNMDRVGRIVRMGSEHHWDDFTRADSTTTAGSDYSAVAGTFGITSNRLYSVTAAVDDKLVRTTDPKLQDLYIEADSTGTLKSTTDRVHDAIMLRYIDSSNFLYVDFYNDTLRIVKQDGGSATALTTATFVFTNGTYYRTGVLAVGRRILVWLNNVLYLDYSLSAANAAKFVVPGNYGIYVNAAGSPATASRVDNYHVFQVTPDYEWTDWKQSSDLLSIELPAFDTGRPSGLLRIEGMAPLTLLTADNVTSLASDDAATGGVVEIATTDAAYQTVLSQARAELFYLLGAEIYPTGIPENSRQYTEMGLAQEALVRSMQRMPVLSTRRRGHVN